MRTKLVALAFAGLTLVLAQAIPAQAAVVVKAGYGSPCTLRFKPAGITIHRGTKDVRRDVCFSHTVTAYSRNWSKNVALTSGQTTSKIFRTKGVFKYRCRYHSTLTSGVCSGMCGKVTVTA